MGDPGRNRKKYRGPPHPWIRERIEEERVLKKDYGLSNKKEIYRLAALLSKFKREAKRLIPLQTQQAEHEKKQLLSKLQSYKLINTGAKLDDVLAISLKDLMERRAQTLLVRKGLARTVKQARQFVTHKHVMVNGKLITSPSTLLVAEEEATLNFVPRSTLSNPSHAEREIVKAEKKEEKKQDKKGKKEDKGEKKEASEKQKKEKKEEPKEESKE
jgi:small subunit ribosomal protein S4